MWCLNQRHNVVGWVQPATLIASQKTNHAQMINIMYETEGFIQARLTHRGGIKNNFNEKKRKRIGDWRGGNSQIGN
jgi:hypothetical protein